MRLFEAIIEANHRAIAGDATASVHIADFENELPVIALTCVDPRLNALLPNVLGLPGEQFIWLRNAGNIVTGPVSSTMRSLALACAVKGGKEIAIIGHTDCHVCKMTTMQLLDKLSELGIDRHRLPENLTELFGLCSSEQQNVIKGCDVIRRSPLIGPKVPVHGFLVDIEAGELEWLVNGYQTLEGTKPVGQTMDALRSLPDFNMGEMKFPETRIGETLAKGGEWLGNKVGQPEIKPAAVTPAPAPQNPPPLPPRIPMPPPLRPRLGMRRGSK